jgi:hypothetical protein
MPSNAGLIYEGLPSFSVVSIWMRVRLGLISWRCQTVPSPFGSGLKTSAVAPWCLLSLSVSCDDPVLGGAEARSASVLNSSNSATVTLECRTARAECQGALLRRVLERAIGIEPTTFSLGS